MKLLTLTLILTTSSVFAQTVGTMSLGRTDSIKVSLETTPEKACDDQLKRLEAKLEQDCSQISTNCRITNSSAKIVSFKKVGLIKKKLKVTCDYQATIMAL